MPEAGNKLLDRGLCARRAGYERGHHVVYRLIEIAGRNDAMNEANPQRLTGIKRRSEQHPGLGFPWAKSSDDVRRDHCRHESHSGFAQGEAGVLRSDDDIGGAQQANGAPIGRAMNAGDHRHLERRDSCEEISEPIGVGSGMARLGGGGKFSNVATSAKHGTVTL